MAAIDIGPGATNRSDYSSSLDCSYVSKTNPANGTGTLSSIELYFYTGGGAASGVKVGTVSKSGNYVTCRDYQNIGNVTAGSKQTFSGLDVDVQENDMLGLTWTNGKIEWDETQSGYYGIESDIFGAGQTEIGWEDVGDPSVYATGETSAVASWGGTWGG